jgi:hypothetical protein
VVGNEEVWRYAKAGGVMIGICDPVMIRRTTDRLLATTIRLRLIPSHQNHLEIRMGTSQVEGLKWA